MVRLRDADDILLEEKKNSGYYKKLWQSLRVGYDNSLRALRLCGENKK